MTPPLPLPVRIAAGLVVTAVEQARDLPRLALELPVTAVSQALQAAMRVQQKVTELAIKGDRVLGVGPPVEDEPAWATFDEDLPPRRPARGMPPVAPLGPVPVPPVVPPGPAATVTPLHAAPDPFVDPGPVDPGSVDPEPVHTGAPVPVEGADGPAALPGYAGLTIPQLRGRLRHLGVAELRELLAWEHAHGDRPPYVTMLSNRITTVSEG